MKQPIFPAVVAAIAFLAVFSLGVLYLEVEARPGDPTRWAYVAVVLCAAFACLLSAALCAKLEEELARRVPPRVTSVRFLDVSPAQFGWGPRRKSPRDVLDWFQGHILHRRIVLAAVALAGVCTRAGASFGLDVVDGRDRFLADVVCVEGAEPGAPARWRIVVRYWPRWGDVARAARGDAALSAEPSVVEALVFFEPGRSGWMLSFEQLEALDPYRVAHLAVDACQSIPGLEPGRVDANVRQAANLRQWSVELRLPADLDRDPERLLEQIQRKLEERCGPTVVTRAKKES